MQKIKNIYNWPLWHWHFEVSSICTLKCPRCPRNEIPESLIQSQLKIEFFEKNFQFGDSIRKITFCGDDGDPIYAKDFLQIVNFFKKQNPNTNINIITNGSYKSKSWWKDLGLILNKNDKVQFSLDGWDQESNEKYRINCDWKSIIDGIEELRSNTNALLQWDAIVFNFNQYNLELMKDLAKQLGFDKFQITKSTKFGSKYKHYNNNESIDHFEPDEEFIPIGHRFERKIYNLTDKQIDDNFILTENLKYYSSVKEKYKNNTITPLCLIGTKGLFVNSQGYLIPCCWIGNRYNHNKLNQFLIPENNINKQGIKQVLNANHWKSFFKNFNIMQECVNKCSTCLVDEKYATDW